MPILVVAATLGQNSSAPRVEREVGHPGQALGFYNKGGAFMHHGKFTTAREAVEAHNGEALAERQAFDALTPKQRDSLIEFLKSLQVLPPGSRSFVVDERGHPNAWPPPGDSAKN